MRSRRRMSSPHASAQRTRGLQRSIGAVASLRFPVLDLDADDNKLPSTVLRLGARASRPQVQSGRDVRVPRDGSPHAVREVVRTAAILLALTLAASAHADVFR